MVKTVVSLIVVLSAASSYLSIGRADVIYPRDIWIDNRAIQEAASAFSDPERRWLAGQLEIIAKASQQGHGMPPRPPFSGVFFFEAFTRPLIGLICSALRRGEVSKIDRFFVAVNGEKLVVQGHPTHPTPDRPVSFRLAQERGRWELRAERYRGPSSAIALDCVTPDETSKWVDITELNPTGRPKATQLDLGKALVASAPEGGTTSYSIARQAAADLYTSVWVKVDWVGKSASPAGLYLRSNEMTGAFQEGELIFGKNVQRLFLWRWEGNRWLELQLQNNSKNEDLDWLEIVKQSGQYEFRANGFTIAQWSPPGPRATSWVHLIVGQGGRAEFQAWQVFRPR